MEAVPESISFPKTEEKILAYWEKIDAFQESLRRSEGKPEYSFYDGPPFATGLPHYGHILAGTIKDTVTRYAHQTGHHVTRRFGWDTHGLPIEFEIDKELGIKTRDDVLKLGIPKYNAECRKIVMRYSSEWEKIVGRLGRWIDFQNDYKTLDPSFMESVWWVFKKLYKKGLVYRGFKVMPYSVGCSTPLSNFEANMAYRDVRDPAVVVSFPLVDEPETKLVAWTTTPWTLPSNLALCVNPDLDYVKLKDKKTGEVYILCEARIAQLYPPTKKGKPEDEYEVLDKFKGIQLKDKQYVPLFPYFEKVFPSFP
jgi:isoleucyl-tRNA synthetase